MNQSIPKVSGKIRLDSLTSLRFIAAFVVMLHHAAPLGDKSRIMQLFGSQGWLGVSFFFILSGFVLMWSFEPLIRPGRYILRRLTRIYPLHLLTLLASLLCFVTLHRFIGGYASTFPGAVASLFLVHDWLPGHPGIRQGWNGVSWSLSCEFFFYVCAPFILPVFARINGVSYVKEALLIWLLLAALVLIAQANGWVALLDFYQFHPLSRLPEFLLGALGARWLNFGMKPPRWIIAIMIMILPLSLYGALAPAAAVCFPLMNLLFAPGAFILILAAAHADLQLDKFWLQNKILVALGEASFSLYMVHAIWLGLYSMLLQYFGILQGETGAVIAGRVTLYAISSVLLSLVVYRWVEVPARMSLLKRLESIRHPAIGSKRAEVTV